MGEKLSVRLLEEAAFWEEDEPMDRLLKEAARLARAVEDAPEGTITTLGDDEDGPRFRVETTRQEIMGMARNPIGKRVKLVEVPDAN